MSERERAQGRCAMLRSRETVKDAPCQSQQIYYVHTNWYLGLSGYVSCTVTYLRFHMAYSVSLEGRLGIHENSKASFSPND